MVSLFFAFSYLKLMHEAFDTQRSNSYTVDTQSDLLQLNSLNAQLGEIIKHRLIGTVAPPIGAVDLLAGASWTPAEIYAQQVRIYYVLCFRCELVTININNS